MYSLFTSSTNTTDAATYFAAQLEQFDKNYYSMVIEEHGVDRPLEDDICWFWQDFFFATLEEAEDFARDNNHKHIIEFTMDDLRAAYLRAFTPEGDQHVVRSQ